MKLGVGFSLALIACLIITGAFKASGTTLVPAEYEDFVSPMAGNVLGGGDGLQTVVAGSITIQPQNPGGTRGGFGSGKPPFVTAPFPRDGEGFLSYNGGNIPSLDRDSIVLTFSDPVAGFGATFFHREIPFSDQPIGTGQPSTIQLFSGVEGTGDLLGQVQSAGLVGSSSTSTDFVGLLSEERNIRSAVLFGPSPRNGFAVDAYAITLVPLPEPSSLVAVAFVGTLHLRRPRSR